MLVDGVDGIGPMVMTFLSASILMTAAVLVSCCCPESVAEPEFEDEIEEEEGIISEHLLKKQVDNALGVRLGLLPLLPSPMSHEGTTIIPDYEPPSLEREREKAKMKQADQLYEILVQQKPQPKITEPSRYDMPVKTKIKNKVPRSRAASTLGEHKHRDKVAPLHLATALTSVPPMSIHKSIEKSNTVNSTRPSLALTMFDRNKARMSAVKSLAGDPGPTDIHMIVQHSAPQSIIDQEAYEKEVMRKLKVANMYSRRSSVSRGRENYFAYN